MKEKEFTASIVGVFILGGNTLTKKPRFYLDKAEIFSAFDCALSFCTLLRQGHAPFSLLRQSL